MLVVRRATCRLTWAFVHSCSNSVRTCDSCGKRAPIRRRLTASHRVTDRDFQQESEPDHAKTCGIMSYLCSMTRATCPAAGRRGQEGRGQRGHGQPGPQRKGRGLGQHQGGRADRPGRARLRAADPTARRAGQADRPGAARAAEPDLPRAGRGDRRRAGAARLHPGAVHPDGRRPVRGGLRRHAARPACVRDGVLRRPLRRGERPARALPAAAQPRRPGGPAQRGRSTTSASRACRPTT